VAVLIPCLNEEKTVAAVVRDFRRVVPEANIYVCDNNSADRTAEVAAEAGAIVVKERKQGKGYVIQSMFRDIDADVYVMVDGDGTYPAESVNDLLAPILDGAADMVIGSRLHPRSKSRFKPLNRLGNRIFLSVLNVIFHVRITDLLSGYRAFGREFVKNAPLVTGGFQIETEMTIKALERGYNVVEIPIDLKSRPEGSHSKIRAWRDGIGILTTILALFRDFKPLTFFGAIGLALIAAGLFPGTIVIVEFIQTGKVPRLPSAVLAVGLVLSGILSWAVGIILHVIMRRVRELEFLLRTVYRNNADSQRAPRRTGERESQDPS
jgi:glycosyltransferase involved in cell wall biosynthesis